jgi:hypothetical protein
LPPNAWQGIGAKIERAKEHLRDLESEVRRFFEANPYQVVVSEQPATGDLVYRVHVVAPPPLRLSTIIGDIIHNLRASLDHLVWQLVRANGGTPNKQTEFLISESLSDFEANAPRRLKGVSAAALQLIKEMKPYKGGDDLLSRLHQLDIIDKHKLLIPIGSAHRNVIIDFGRMLPNSTISMPVALRPADRQYPLEDGAEVYRVMKAARTAHSDDSVQFTFELSFGEGGIVQDQPVVETLQQLIDHVEWLMQPFRSLLWSI